MARGQQATLLNGMSGLTFRTNLNNMFNDLYGPSMSLQTTIWVDPNRIDSYTADGSIQFPYKSLGGAFTALNTSNLPGVVINIASSTYTESSQVTVPTTLQGPVVINGNGATITFSIGFTVPNLFGFPAYIYGLNFGTTASGVLTFANGSANRNIIDGGSVGMSLLVGSATPATLEARSCNIVPNASGVTVGASSYFFPIGCTFSGSQPINLTAGTSSVLPTVLNMSSCRVLNTINSGFQVVSTGANSQVVIADSYFNNTGTGTAGCINVSNSAPSTLPNFLGNIVALTTNTTSATIIAGTAYTVFSKVYQNTGSAFQIPNGTTLANVVQSADIVPTTSSGNTNTALYSGVNPIAFATSGSTSLTLPTSGSVVVGPTANAVSFTSNTTALTLIAPVAGGSFNLPVATGGFPVTFTTTASTGVTLPTSGTLLSGASASVNATATAGGTITSTTVLSVGLGVVTTGVARITPTQSTRVLVTISGNVAIATATAVVSLRLYSGTTANTYNVAPTGTATGSLFTLTPGAVGVAVPFSFTQVVTGLSVGTLQYFELGAFAASANALTFTNLWVSIVEV